MKEYIKQLHHIGIPTTKMDETISFYCSLGASIIYEKVDEEEGEPIRVTLFKLCNVVIECYERRQTAKVAGAIEHIAFEVTDIEKMYRVAKEKGYRFMDDCKNEIQKTSYWPGDTRWFIIYGPNEEKIEFSQNVKP